MRLSESFQFRLRCSYPVHQSLHLCRTSFRAEATISESANHSIFDGPCFLFPLHVDSFQLFIGCQQVTFSFFFFFFNQSVLLTNSCIEQLNEMIFRIASEVICLTRKTIKLHSHNSFRYTKQRKNAGGVRSFGGHFSWFPIDKTL